MAQFMKFPSFVRTAVMKYLRENYKAEDVEPIWNKILEIYKQFVDEAPDIGGKENHMSKNLYMALAFFAFYEATDRRLAREDIESMISECMPKSIPVYSQVNDFNKPRNQEKVRNRWKKYKELSDEKLDKGEWGNSWRVELNPHNREKGVAIDLVGCPLADFARSHGYEDIMPAVCTIDYPAAALIHARLIREHTVAEGSKYCDYWYVGDKDI